MLRAAREIMKSTRLNSYLTKLTVLLEKLTVVQLIRIVPAFIRHAQ
jgi:hypothetical protein